jgi:hypothetical protein
MSTGLLLQQAGEDFKELTWRNSLDALEKLREVTRIARYDVFRAAF